MLRSFAHRYRSHRFAILFFSLLLTLVGAPVLRALGVKHLLEGFLALNAIAAVFGAAIGSQLRILLALFGVFAAVRAASFAAGEQALLPASEAVWVVVALPAMAGTLRYALRRGPVDAERIYAALSVYLLAGAVFGVTYWTQEQIWQGSFGASSGGEFTLPRALYFSFVTLASLGYGDIVPVSEVARGLAILEVIGGQIYLVVLVARLVSLYGRGERGGE